MSKYHDDEKIRHEIDELLRINMSLECKIGKDSTKSEKEEIVAMQDDLFWRIKLLDEEFYEQCVNEDERKRLNNKYATG